MSACLPIKWLPDSLPAQVEAALRGILDRWSSDWGAPAARQVEVRRIAAGVTPSTDGTTSWAEMPAAWPTALGSALLGAAAAASPVARIALHQAFLELQDALRQRFATGPAKAFVPAQIGHGGIEASFELLGLRFVLVLDVAELAAGGWLTASPRQPLPAISVEQALHGVSVPLTAQVGRASASVTDILQLRPGDILLLSESLDAPLQVTSPGSPLLLSAHLGASDSPSTSPRRAMRWLASS